jgi:hypothetical protein
VRAFTINQVAAVYELQPWQRDLLAGMLMSDRRRRRALQSYRDRAERQFNAIVDELSAGNLDAFITTSESQPAVTPTERYDQEGEAKAEGSADPEARH